MIFLLVSFLSFHAISVIAYRIVFVQEWQGSSLTSSQHPPRTFEQFPISQYSYFNVYNYTLSHGYEYKLVDIDGLEIVHALNYLDLSRSWLKVFAVRELLRSGNYDYVVFMGSNFFIQRPEVSLTEVIKKWRGLADVYIARDVDLISSLQFTSSDLKEEQIDGSWKSGFQIWKNTMKNQELFERWMFSTKREFRHSIWRTQSPYEMGSFVQDILPFMQEQRRFCHVIELREGMDSEKFIGTSPMLTERSDNDTNHPTFNPPTYSFFNLSESLEDYSLSPEYWLAIKYMKQIDNEVVHVSYSLNFEFYELVDLYLRDLDSILDSHCKSQGISPLECSKLMDYVHMLEREKGIVIKEYYINSFYRNFIRQNPNFLQDRLPAVQPRIEVMNTVSRTIMTIFAGRRDRLVVLMKYVKLALSLNIIQEVHLWDYCASIENRFALLEFIDPSNSVFLKSRSTTQKGWHDYYEYYDKHRLSYPNDIIIKCDDDIVFIDVFKLPYFLSRVREEDELLDGVLFANIVNNGVAAHYQQTLWNLLPKDVLGEFEYPEGGFFGSLWSSGDRATQLHHYFLNHWEEIIRPQNKSLTNSTLNEVNEVFYEPEFLPIHTRFSINFFAMHVKNWYKIKDIGAFDEFFMTKAATQHQIMKNYLCSNFFVSHLSFFRQNSHVPVNHLLNLYDNLYEEYVKKYSPT